MNTKRYVVTALAGPKVSGRVAKKGDILELTEPEAREELLAGTLQPEGSTDVENPLKGSDKLADIQARARGLDKAPEPPAESQAPKAGKSKSVTASDGAPADTPPAA